MNCDGTNGGEVSAESLTVPARGRFDANDPYRGPGDLEHLILVQGVIAMAGFAVGSARKSRLKDWANHGNRGAAAALRLSEDPRYLHWTMQAWITLLGVLAGVYAGAAVEPELSRGLEPIGQLAAFRHVIGIGVVALTITLATLVLGELVPRKIAHYRPDHVAKLVSRPIQVLGWFAVPVVGTLSAGTDFVLRLMGVRPTPEPPVTQEQIQVLIQEGAKAGVFEEGEHEMIKRVFRFCDRRARALMTPRNEIIWIDQADSPDEIRRKVISSPHTRFPVCDQSLDNLLGVVDVKNLLGQDQNVDAFRIKGRLTLPLFIYEGTRGLKILEMFKEIADAGRRRSRRIRDRRGLVTPALHGHSGSHRGRHARDGGRGSTGRPATGRVVASGWPAASGRIPRPLRPVLHLLKATSTRWQDSWSRSSATSHPNRGELR